MVPKTIVEYDRTGLEMVINALIELKEENFIEGIHNRHHSVYEIRQTTMRVKQQQLLVDIEYNSLQDFAEYFIPAYATKNNTCFDTAAMLCRKIHSTLKGLKDVFKKTSPIDRRQLPAGVDAPSVFDISPLSQGASSHDLFGMDSYSKEVRDLYDAICNLFTTATSILDLCQKMMELEESTRKDIVQVRISYQKTCQRIAESLNGVRTIIRLVDDLPPNKLELRRQKAGSEYDESFLKENYHKVDEDEMTRYVIIKMDREARHDGLTPIENRYWYNNHEKALMVRKVVENFDQLSDVKGKQKGKLSKWVIVEFLKWCEVPEGLECQLYRDYFVPNYQVRGNYEPMGWSTISDARKDLKEDGATDESLAKQFEKRLSGIFPSEAKQEKERPILLKMG